MAKTHKLSTRWNVNGGIMSIETSASDGANPDAFIGKFSKSLNLGELFKGYASLDELGQSALEFGAFTTLRNATGAADTLAEAEAAMDRRIDAWLSGEWGAEREQSAVPFTENSLLAKAVERASNGAQSASEAAAKLSAIAETTCTQNGLAAFASLETADRAKIRKAVVDSIKENKPLIGAALAQLEAERAAEAAKRKADAAAKKLGESAGGDTTL